MLSGCTREGGGARSTYGEEHWLKAPLSAQARRGGQGTHGDEGVDGDEDVDIRRRTLSSGAGGHKGGLGGRIDPSRIVRVILAQGPC